MIQSMSFTITTIPFPSCPDAGEFQPQPVPDTLQCLLSAMRLDLVEQIVTLLLWCVGKHSDLAIRACVLVDPPVGGFRFLAVCAHQQYTFTDGWADLILSPVFLIARSYSLRLILVLCVSCHA